MDLEGFCAVVLAGGQAIRLGGFDKASVEVDGRTLLAHALDAVVDASEVVVVGAPVVTERPVTFVVEDPRHGGPVAGLLTGCDALLRRTRTVVVLAVDMPRVTTATVRRLHDAARGRDGAVLVGPDGRRQAALVLDRARLAAVRPDHEGQHGMALRRLLEPLDLAEVAATGDEHRDVDTWADLRDLAGLRSAGPHGEIGPMNLHDWIDELCDVLDLETEVDEGLLNDLAELAHDNVDPQAGPVTAYLLGYAAGGRSAGPVTVERLATAAQELAEGWDRPADARDPVDIDDEIPDDRGIDHTVDLDLDPDDPEDDEDAR